ncbi:unnamed protein product [Mytilus coruscus]|uniref:Uncharacterized protein n=1 Tax=Mytilus coruscus TaxID=42192 RepID=A0A6J8EQB0_MYTCO|nr:unnamed protein product [Mytilus coruscus]
MVFRQLQPSVFKRAGSAPGYCVYIDLSGASSGIGEATAIKLAEYGATLFLVALEEGKLQIVQQKCMEKGLIREKADIAGYALFSSISETKEEDYDRFVNVNQKAKFFLAQLCLPYLKETKELGAHGVRVNAINPGFIDDTNILRNSLKATDEDQKKVFSDNSAKQAHLNRTGKPADVVSLLLFLASDEASYITGSINSIDGGKHLYP